MKSLVLTTLIATLPLVAAPAFAADEINVSNGISAAGAPLAAHGVDLVALVHDGNPVEGFATHSATYDGASYYFTSAANREAFEANPAAYLPQHGGFCSFGVSVGKKFDGDPDQVSGRGWQAVLVPERRNPRGLSEGRGSHGKDR